MKNVSWDSQIYAVSYGKILLLLLSLFFLFVDTGINIVIRAVLPFLIQTIFWIFGEKGRTTLQIWFYVKRKANYQISEEELTIRFGKRKRVIKYKNIQSFSDVSPFLMTEELNRGSASGVDYARSSEFAVYYLFIRYNFYVEILPIFLPFNMKDEIVNNLSAFIKFAPYHKYQK